MQNNSQDAKDAEYQKGRQQAADAIDSAKETIDQAKDKATGTWSSSFSIIFIQYKEL